MCSLFIGMLFDRFFYTNMIMSCYGISSGLVVRWRFQYYLRVESSPYLTRGVKVIFLYVSMVLGYMRIVEWAGYPTDEGLAAGGDSPVRPWNTPTFG